MSEREEPRDIVSGLQGIKTCQLALRRLLARDKPSPVGAALEVMFIARYYRALPVNVAHRLTCMEPTLRQRAQGPLDVGLDDVKNRQALFAIAQALAGDEALAQVIRAANHYRAALGWAPMGPDGRSQGKKQEEATPCP